LVSIDRDPAATAKFGSRLVGELGYVADETHSANAAERGYVHSDRCSILLCSGSYCDLPAILASHGIESVEMILLDLGLSSDQLDDVERGFSFRLGGALDLRFDPESGPSAADLVNGMGEKELADLIYQFGEERYSRRISRAIVAARRVSRIETSESLRDIVHRSVPGRTHGRIDSATRTFQALRIAVNRELEHVERAMKSLPECLSIGGRFIIISFHSLEDRIVKHALRESSTMKVLTKKPVIASSAETERNPRSRSAKLRVGERIS
jgi:16S rRNA (cytosine1402-N4)-methyltransferase